VASNRNHRDPTRPLHADVALSSGGKYLGLIAPDGVAVVSEYAPTFPAQRDNVSHGISQATAKAGEIGFLVPPHAAGAQRRRHPGTSTAALEGTPGIEREVLLEVFVVP